MFSGCGRFLLSVAGFNPAAAKLKCQRNLICTKGDDMVRTRYVDGLNVICRVHFNLGAKGDCHWRSGRA
jgi:hypothetical protein